MSNQTSPDTSAVNRKATEWSTEEDRTFCFLAMWLWSNDGDDNGDMLFNVGCAAYFIFCCDDNHRSSHWVVPHYCYTINAAAACAEWCAERSHCWKICQLSTSPSQATGFYLVFHRLPVEQMLNLLLHYIYSIFASECICSEYIHYKNSCQHVGFTWKFDANCWLYCLRASIALC